MRQTQRSPEGPRHLHRIPRLSEAPRETGLILRCAGKAGNPFQTTQGNRLSCREQEGRRGSDEAVPGDISYRWTDVIFGLLGLSSFTHPLFDRGVFAVAFGSLERSRPLPFTK